MKMLTSKEKKLMKCLFMFNGSASVIFLSLIFMFICIFARDADIRWGVFHNNNTILIRRTLAKRIYRIKFQVFYKSAYLLDQFSILWIFIRSMYFRKLKKFINLCRPNKSILSDVIFIKLNSNNCWDIAFE